MPTSMFNPFDDLLETNRELPFLGELQRRGLSSSKRNALWGQFGEIQRNFMGKLGSQILGGNAPTARFADYLKDMDFDREYKMLSPRQRGTFGGSPRVRHLLRF